VSHSGSTLGADNPDGLLDQAEGAGNAQPDAPAPMTAPTQHPAPPLGDGDTETGAEDVVPLSPAAVDAVLREDYAPAPVETQSTEPLTGTLSDAPVPQAPVVLLGLVAALALNGNRKLRQANERRPLLP
jgi:hypothetical protein